MTALLVSGSRDKLAEVLHDLHNRCTEFPHCYGAGRARDDADALLASGVVVTVESLATNEALVIAVHNGLRAEGADTDWLDARAAVRALAAVLAVPGDVTQSVQSPEETR